MSEEDEEKEKGYLGDAEVQRAHNVFLIVSDKVENCEKLLYFVMRYAKKIGAGIGIVHVAELPEYQHWNNIEEQIRAEMRSAAEAEVYALADRLAEHVDIKPVFYFKEGDLAAEIVKTIKEDDAITGLFLSGRGASSRQEEMIKHFAGKGMDQLVVPLTIIPEHLELNAIDELF
jgi:hypothetical protein